MCCKCFCNAENLRLHRKLSEMAEERKWLEGLLGCRIQIQVSDGRLLEGIFSCVDRGCNVILRNTTEWKLSRAQDSNEEVNGFSFNQHASSNSYQCIPNFLITMPLTECNLSNNEGVSTKYRYFHGSRGSFSENISK